MGSLVIEGASGPASPAALACAREVEAYFHRVIGALDVVRDGLEEVCRRTPLVAADLVAAAHPLTRDLLEGLPLFGGGFVAAPGFLADHHLYLAWWQGEERQLLAQSTVSGSGDPVDYSRVEWYRTPVESGRPHVTGPFVDYVCSDSKVSRRVSAPTTPARPSSTLPSGSCCPPTRGCRPAGWSRPSSAAR